MSTKTTAALMCLILTTVVGSGIALVYAWQEKHRMDEMVSANVGDVVAMGKLDVALLKQRGYVEAYLPTRRCGEIFIPLRRIAKEMGALSGAGA